jgi:HEPN domain-containing protein
MVTRDDLKKLARLRLREAEALYREGLYDGAAYLCGYAIELALKARICKVLGIPEYPNSEKLKRVYAVHDLAQLLLLAGLQPKIKPANATLFRNWSVAVNWKPERRYEPPGTYSRQQALEILEAVRSRNQGVLQWLTKRW